MVIAERYRSEAIRCDLERGPRGCLTQAFDKNIAGGLVAFPHRDVEDQLAVTLNADPHVAVAEHLAIFGPNTLLFLPDEGPNFITFHVTYLDAADLISHDAFTLLANEHQEFQDRCMVNSSHTLNRRNAGTFDQQANYQFRLIDRQVHSIKRLVASVRKYLATLRTLITLTVLAFTELAAIDPAGMTGHGISS